MGRLSSISNSHVPGTANKPAAFLVLQETWNGGMVGSWGCGTAAVLQSICGYMWVVGSELVTRSLKALLSIGSMFVDDCVTIYLV